MAESVFEDGTWERLNGLRSDGGQAAYYHIVCRDCSFEVLTADPRGAGDRLTAHAGETDHTVDIGTMEPALRSDGGADVDLSIQLAADALVEEHGAQGADEELQERIRSSTGIKQGWALAALAYLRRELGVEP